MVQGCTGVAALYETKAFVWQNDHYFYLLDTLPEMLATLVFSWPYLLARYSRHRTAGVGACAFFTRTRALLCCWAPALSWGAGGHVSGGKGGLILSCFLADLHVRVPAECGLITALRHVM